MVNPLDSGKIIGWAIVVLPLNSGNSMLLQMKKNVSIAEVWDGNELKISFRRRVSNRLMLSWLDLVSIAESITFTEDCDSIFWAFDGSGKFSVQSMYRTISFRGILPAHTPAVWKLCVPTRIHIFLWLLSNNKTLTRTNLAKRRHVEDITCLFCNENESVHHLFFGCCVASVMWRHLSEIFDVNLGADYESVARWWLSNNRHAIMNMTCAALMWSIWKLRNDLCFQGKAWRSEKVLLYKLLGTLRNWQLLCKEAYLVDLASVLEALELKLCQPLHLQDGPPRSRELVSSSLGPSAGKASEAVRTPTEQPIVQRPNCPVERLSTEQPSYNVLLDSGRA